MNLHEWLGALVGAVIAAIATAVAVVVALAIALVSEPCDCLACKMPDHRPDGARPGGGYQPCGCPGCRKPRCLRRPPTS